MHLLERRTSLVAEDDVVEDGRHDRNAHGEPSSAAGWRCVLELERDTTPLDPHSAAGEDSAAVHSRNRNTEQHPNLQVRNPAGVRADGEIYGIALSDPIRRSVVLGIPPFETLEVIL